MARRDSSAARAESAETFAARAASRPAGGRGVWIESGSRRFRSRSDRLSGKERLVLAELARGHTTEEIGTILHVSPHTVRTHIKNAMRKLEAKTRAHAVAIALSERAIELEAG
jgi:DNA-binding CsgD family transcriptional regulator